MTMILTSMTMVGWADVPDSDWGDFRCRLAIDISSFVWNWPNTMDMVSALWISMPCYIDLCVMVAPDCMLLNTLRPKQNGCHFPDDIFKWIFLNENVWISMNISLRFVPRGPINNIPTLVHVMAWRRPGDKPLSEPMMVRLPTHICVTRPQWAKGLITVGRELRQKHPSDLLSGAEMSRERSSKDVTAGQQITRVLLP